MPWLAGAVAGLFLAVGLLSLPRLVTAAGHRADEAFHLVMAAGMAATTVPAADPLPGSVWVTAFAAAGTWAVVTIVRLGPVHGEHGLTIGPVAWRRDAGRAVHHLAASLLMLAMLITAHGGVHGGTHGGGHGGPHGGGAASAPVDGGSVMGGLGLIVGGAFLVLAVRSAATLPVVVRSGRRAGATLTWPVLLAIRSTIMAAGMAAMALTA